MICWVKFECKQRTLCWVIICYWWQLTGYCLIKQTRSSCSVRTLVCVSWLRPWRCEYSWVLSGWGGWQTGAVRGLCQTDGSTGPAASTLPTHTSVHTHTHTRLTALFQDYPGEPVPETHTHSRLTAVSGTTQVSRYQKGKTNLDFTEARDSEWQWHQLGNMQVCTSLQTDNHTSTPPLSFYRQDALPAAQPKRQSTEGTIPTIYTTWVNVLHQSLTRTDVFCNVSSGPQDGKRWHYVFDLSMHATCIRAFSVSFGIKFSRYAINKNHILTFEQFNFWAKLNIFAELWKYNKVMVQMNRFEDRPDT